VSADEELEPRVAALEAEMARVRERLDQAGDDATAARVLASGADHAVSEVRAELRAHRGALNALQETLSETRRDMHAGFAEMRGQTDAGFAEMRAGFRAVADRLDRSNGSA
jgi:predicted  nucleic acid-binding Zn-ribbon protein